MLARWQAVCLERITRQDNATVRRIGISSGGGDGTNTGGRRPSGSDVMGTTSRRQTGAGDAAAAGSRRQTGAGEVGVSRPGTAAAPGKKEGRPPSPEKKGKGGEEKKGGDKGRPGSPTKGGAGGGAVGTSVYPPPLQRTVGAHMTTKEAQEAEELAMQLLQVPRLSGCAEVLSHYSVKAVARVLHTYMRVDAVKGPAACAKLLECMSPLMAIKFLYPMYDVPLPLLPPEQRRLLLGACRPELLRVLSSLQSKVNEASLKRSRQMRVLLQCFAAHSVVTSAQLAVILRYLRFEQDRCTATVSLWSRVLNREFMYDAWQVLTNNEQRSIKYRLGPWHVWMTLARPQGLHFYIDMTDTEQKDIAKEVLKMAVKATTAAKASGGIMRGGHLLNLRGNGSAMSIPEDDKMWMMVESSYQSIEFDYAPSTEQVRAAD
ncbi:hypothetical protein FOA52_003182 [Chlamydomonas sp. UWO 241]|nr:hypothetical protein FOA52_003182 [Chlamydomonas sp. UWO 241]